MESSKTLLIDAIIGKSFPSMEYAERMVKDGFATFTGNQWNPDWEWNREKLEALTEAELKDIYYNGGKGESIKPWDIGEAVFRALGGSVDLRKLAMKGAAKAHSQNLDEEMISILLGE